MAHCVAKSRAWLVVAFAVAKCRRAANRRKQNWRVAHGMQDLRAFAITRRAHSDEVLHGHRRRRRRIVCSVEIVFKDPAQPMPAIADLSRKKVADYRAEEKP